MVSTGVQLPKTTWGAPPALRQDDGQRIASALAAALSPATRRVYRSQWALWTAWASDRDVNSLPAEPLAVAAYVSQRAQEDAAVATIQVTLAAISAVHRDAGLPNPADHEGLRRVMAGIKRTYSSSQRQADAITAAELGAIKATAPIPRTGPSGRTESPAQAQTRALVDLALISVMRDGLLRRSEAAALTWGDVEWAPDGSGRITIPRSKTDQEGDGAVLYLGPDTMRALRAIRNPGCTSQDLLFCLSDAQINRRIKAAASAAGLDGDFSGHSLRVGMAQDLSAIGCELPALMNAGRWATSAMPARYTRSQAAARGAVARYYASSSRTHFAAF